MRQLGLALLILSTTASCDIPAATRTARVLTASRSASASENAIRAKGCSAAFERIDPRETEDFLNSLGGTWRNNLDGALIEMDRYGLQRRSQEGLLLNAKQGQLSTARIFVRLAQNSGTFDDDSDALLASGDYQINQTFTRLQAGPVSNDGFRIVLASAGDDAHCVFYAFKSAPAVGTGTVLFVQGPLFLRAAQTASLSELQAELQETTRALIR